MSVGDIISIINKENPAIKTMRDLEILRVYDQVIGNNIYQMLYYICDENKFLIPSRFRNPVEHVNYPDLLKDNCMTMQLTKGLVERSNLLPSKGIECILANNDFVKSISMHEVVKDGLFTMIYNVRFNDLTEVYGFYNPKRELFYSMWKHSSAEKDFHTPLMNLVLGIYKVLTCSYVDKESENILELHAYINSLIANIDIKETSNRNDRNTNISNKRILSINEYNSQYKKISPYLRKLPMGFNASKDAISEANKFGIVLNQGMTFVKEFSRVTYKK